MRPWKSSPGTDRIDVLGLDKSGRRRIAVLASVRLLVVLAVLLGGYFVVPVEGFKADNPTAAWVGLSIVILVFLAVLVLEARIVVAARVPQVRAVAAAVESVMLFICLFALLHLSLSTTDPASFSEPLDRMGALYFSVSTLATVGFGDISPATQLARAVVTVQMLAGLGVLVLIGKVTFYAARQGMTRNP